MPRLLILSDIHGSWPAWQAIVAAEPSFEAAVCCGDIVDSAPFPSNASRGFANTANTSSAAITTALAFGVDCRCLGGSRESSLTRRAWRRRLISELDRDALSRMPTLDWFEYDGRHVRLAHASPQGDLFEYLSPDQWEDRIQRLSEDFVLLGPTHVLGLRNFGRTIVVNPGCVGLARDGAGESCSAVYDHGRIRLNRAPYDVGQTVAALRRGSLPDSVVQGRIQVLTPRPPESTAALRVGVG